MPAKIAGESGKRHARHKGVGAGVWLIAALFQLNLSVAHGLGAGTRVHFGAGLTF